MFKKKLFLLFALTIAVSLFLSACSSSTNNPIDNNENERIDAKTTIYYFWGDGCPHCTVQKEFLDEMLDKYPELGLKSFETWKNTDNAKILQDMAKAYGTRAAGVPMTFIGDFEPTVGFSSQMKEAMEDKIIFCLEEACPDPGDKIN